MDEGDVRHILEAVDSDEIVGFAQDLMRMPSFVGAESGVARWLVAWMAERCLEAELQEVEPGRFNAIGRLRGSGGGKSLMLNGHMDIDPLAKDWKRDPWTPVVEGNRLFGAGISNMKAGLAAILGAVSAIVRSGVQLPGDLLVAGVVGELQGGVGTKYLVEHGPRPDMAIVTEPYGATNIVTVHTGWAQAAVHVLGNSRHISEKRFAIDAIQNASKAIEALDKIAFTVTPRPDLPAVPAFLVGNIIGGLGRDYNLRGANYVADFVTMICDIRFNHSQTLESVEADIRRTLDAVRADDPAFEYELEIPPPAKYQVCYEYHRPYELPKGAYILDATLRAYRRVTGKDPDVAGGAILPEAPSASAASTSYAADDTSHLMHAGIPCLLFGPGGYYDRPNSDMYTIIPEMETVAKVLGVVAADVCGGQS